MISKGRAMTDDELLKRAAEDCKRIVEAVEKQYRRVRPGENSRCPIQKEKPHRGLYEASRGVTG